MHPNAQLIHHFYSSFQQKDYQGMQTCYAENAIFSDPVFVNLNSRQAKAMWEMLCKRGKDLQLEFSNIHADDKRGSAEWIASYTFSGTGRHVVNRIKAEFEFRDGKILRHTDTFRFSKWASQALGLTGLLFGMTTFLKLKVRAKARQSLEEFMHRQ